jgi:hypothetical protein
LPVRVQVTASTWIAITPPKEYFDWPEEQRLEWIRQLQAEVLADVDG